MAEIVFDLLSMFVTFNVYCVPEKQDELVCESETSWRLSSADSLDLKPATVRNSTELASVDSGFCTTGYFVGYFTRNHDRRSAKAREPLRQVRWGRLIESSSAFYSQIITTRSGVPHRLTRTATQHDQATAMSNL